MTECASDDVLLQRMSAGDEEAFTALYRRRQGGIYRFALQMSGSEAVAEDVTQEVFLALMRRPQRYDAARGSLMTFLYGVARNHVLRHLERNRPGAPIPEDLIDSGDPLSDVSRQETVDAVRQAVLALPPHYREAVVLCDLQEMDYAQAAAVLGCAMGTVRSRLHRARALLTEKLKLRGLHHERQGV
jgi:RNA polymerase sigma-70 factor (ECF subfamily)